MPQYKTQLTPEDEKVFQDWFRRTVVEKQLHINPDPDNPLHYYDFRGAWKAGFEPEVGGHWPDTWKIPGHPTFSKESINAKYAPELAGEWDGENYLPPNMYGYPIRKPTASEIDFFYKNKHVSGYAAEDGSIVLNPFSEANKVGVAKDEAARLYMRERNIVPKFALTPEQRELFKGTDYGKPGNEKYLMQTILARIMTGDPSGGLPTEEQQKWSRQMLEALSALERRQRGQDKAAKW